METLWQGIWIGLTTALTPANLLYVVLGCVIGTFIGLLPGLGPIAAIALMIPVSYALDPAAALIMMAGVYYGAVFGGSTSSILINAPGESSTVATSFDGYPLAKRGEAGKALTLAAMSSFVGGTVGAILLLLAAVPLAAFGVSLRSTDYFLLMLLGLLCVAGFAGRGQLVKAYLSMLLGIMLATVGTDPIAGVFRFTYGNFDLIDGIGFSLLAMSVFALPEALAMALSKGADQPIRLEKSALQITRSDLREVAPTVSRSSVLGFLIGILPGAGATIASFLAYGTERALASPQRREEFGQGSLRGLAAPESANNAASSGSFVPLLTLGIPGSGTTAVLMGAMIAHGVQPGPRLMETEPAVFWGVIVSMYLGNVVLLLLNLPLIPYLARLLYVPRRILVPMILMFCLLGVYLVSFNVFDLYVFIAIGALAMLLRLLDVPLAPLLLGFVLGGPLEQNLRTVLQVSGGDWSIWWERPITLVLSTLVITVVVGSTLRSLWSRLQDRRASP